MLSFHIKFVICVPSKLNFYTKAAFPFKGKIELYLIANCLESELKLNSEEHH